GGPLPPEAYKGLVGMAPPMEEGRAAPAPGAGSLSDGSAAAPKDAPAGEIRREVAPAKPGEPSHPGKSGAGLAPAPLTASHPRGPVHGNTADMDSAIAAIKGTVGTCLAGKTIPKDAKLVVELRAGALSKLSAEGLELGSCSDAIRGVSFPAI